MTHSFCQKRLFSAIVACCGAALFMAASLRGGSAESRVVLTHAHNDYEHPHPLFDALSLGFDSVEADVHLVDDRLLVAHDLKETQSERTLEKLYLDPLANLAQKNGGWIKTPNRPLILLVDVKSEALSTEAALHAVLARYSKLLTVFRKGQTTLGAVTVLISGNRAVDQLTARPTRFAALDGRLNDIDSAQLPEAIPLVSGDWRSSFDWLGLGAPRAEEIEKLHHLVERVHEKKRQLRFWNTPDKPVLWRVLRDAGVDYIGADDLVGLRAFCDEK